MRKLFVLIIAAITVTIFAGFKNHSGENQTGDCRFIGESLKDISEIKVGMTRKDLLESFGEEGGISTRTQRNYVYNKCRFIKVAVKFSPVGNEQNKAVESANDKIIEISKPFLEYAVID